MSRFYDASQKSEKERHQSRAVGPAPANAPVQSEEIPNVSVPTSQKPRLVNFEIPVESRLVAMTDPHSSEAEKFRVLANQLESLREALKGLRSLQVSSLTRGEGKTLVSANLALTFALSASKVLLIEGNLRNPQLSAVFGLTQVSGLTDWWSGARPDINQSIFQLQDLPLWLLLSGGTPEQPAEILQSAQFASVFALLSSQFDWIVVDSPPISAELGVSHWSKLVNGTLLVVREGVTPVKALKSGLLSYGNAKVLGMVYNGSSDPEA